VESENDPNQLYIILKQVNNEICCAMVCSACKICIHTFKCSCLDYSIKSIICKHIHFIALNIIKSENKLLEDLTSNLLTTYPTPETDADVILTSTKTNKQSETEELEVHMKTLGNSKKDENIYAKFKEKATSMVNKITSIQNLEHLKVAMQKLEALDAFIDVTSKETATGTEFIKTNSDPPNKK